jgi:hypothetical protein
MPDNKLLKLYESKINGLSSLNRELVDFGDYDGPFLMSPPCEDYRNSKKRLLVVGQETNGWVGERRANGLDDIHKNMQVYKDFDFGGARFKNSNFFRYMTYSAEQITDKNIFMWTNVLKFGKKSGRGTPSEKVIAAERKFFNVLIDEIKIIDPTCVLFVSGPNYDSRIQKMIPDAEFLEVEGFGIRQIAKIKSVHLPMVSYRIYHPGYGNRKKDLYKRTIDIVRLEHRNLYWKMLFRC